MTDIIELIQKQPDLYVMTGASAADVEKAECELGLRFAKDYRKYVEQFGAASFSNRELTGVCQSARLSVVAVTIYERSKVSVPEDWYVIEQTNIDSIVIWQAAAGDVYKTIPGYQPERICNSLAEYIQ